ncbi:MAG: cell division protein FtsA [Treponema sp.]|jgi:cell division protein FtsA|nr:cell division protein FtsA [Treponema sp.]
MVNEDLVVGLDIGTTKVCVVIAERNEKGILEITGVGVSPSTGMRKGVVVNIEAVIKSIIEAIEAAEMMSGRELNACWTGIGGSHIEGINSRGVVAIAGQKRENREISKDDMTRVIEAARAVVIPLDRQIIQTIPQSYTVDDHPGIKDPLGMIGVRLESEVHIITSSATSAENLLRCVNRAGFKANNSLLLLQVLAAGRAVLTPEERDLGVALLDMGGGTTDVLVYYDGAPYSTFTIPVGGVEVTKDISTIKSISIEVAEKIKQESACCWEPLLEYDEDILVPGMGGRPPLAIPRSHVYAIVRPRMEEIFDLVKQKLDCLGLPRPLSGGIVITGGAAALAGAVELAGEIFKMPVRLGMPIHFANLGGLIDEYRAPAYATAIGLTLEGDRREKDEASERETSVRPLLSTAKNAPGFLSRLKNWIWDGLF